MGTKNFNVIDKFISWMRLGKVLGYIENNDDVLDFGCGHQAYLLSSVKDKIHSGVGIDYDSKSRKVAKNISIQNYFFTDTLPQAKNSFNKIVMLAVLEHVELKNVLKLFAEFHRILKPGGLVILTTPTPLGKIILEFLAFKLRIISAEEVGDHKKYYNKSDLIELAEASGFKMLTYRTFQLGGNSICVFKK